MTAKILEMAKVLHSQRRPPVRCRGLTAKREPAKPKFIDLFAGIGGFRIGFQRAGYECVFSCEKEKNCRETYFANFGDKPARDIRDVDPSDIPPYDILAAGFPCQPFSISGKQKGFGDPRAEVFSEILRIIRKTHPRVVVLENVKHLKHVGRGKIFEKMLQSISELGYEPDWRLLNSSDFGMAQHRERIIIVATRMGERKFDYSKLRTKPRKNLKEILDDQGFFEWMEDPYTLLPEEIRKRKPSGLMFAGYRNKNVRKSGVVPNTTHLSRTHKQPNRIYSAEGLHPTIPSQESSGRFWILHDDKVRKLTLNECYKLMGFPVSFKKVSSRGEQYKQIGNSVCIPMVVELAKQIKRQVL